MGMRCWKRMGRCSWRFLNGIRMATCSTNIRVRVRQYSLLPVCFPQKKPFCNAHIRFCKMCLWHVWILEAWTHLPARSAVLWFPMTSKLNVKKLGELQFYLLHGDLRHVHFHKTLCGEVLKGVTLFHWLCSRVQKILVSTLIPKKTTNPMSPAAFTWIQKDLPVV